MLFNQAKNSQVICLFLKTSFKNSNPHLFKFYHKIKQTNSPASNNKILLLRSRVWISFNSNNSLVCNNKILSAQLLTPTNFRHSRHNSNIRYNRYKRRSRHNKCFKILMFNKNWVASLSQIRYNSNKMFLTWKVILPISRWDLLLIRVNRIKTTMICFPTPEQLSKQKEGID